ncbi:hypothetical protein WG66_006636 [Moniliophthora roreri]|nr:hypothetical protein WG66_006636 [Moniliophthora roreri]
MDERKLDFIGFKTLDIINMSQSFRSKCGEYGDMVLNGLLDNLAISESGPIKVQMDVVPPGQNDRSIRFTASLKTGSIHAHNHLELLRSFLNLKDAGRTFLQ